jgi:hypothetical protein
MVLLDATDVPLHIAKQLIYVGDARGGAVQRYCRAGANVFFVLFMLSFAVIRLGRGDVNGQVEAGRVEPACCLQRSLEP